MRLAYACGAASRLAHELFVAVLLVVGFYRLFSVASRMDCMRPCYMSVVRRFLVMSALVVLCCFTMMAGRVAKMLLRLLVVFSGFFRHCCFLQVLFAAKTQTVTCSPSSLG
jgi:hypothetical protein